MGIYGHYFYYKKELPKVNEIKKKFLEITGLQLGYHSIVEVNDLATEHDDILYAITKATEELKNSFPLGRPLFTCEGFEPVYLDDYMQPESRAFYIVCGIRTENMYFFNALIKTFLELGGYTNNLHIYPPPADLDFDKHLEPYNPHERKWKRIKKLNEMCDVEKAAFKGKHS
ncbi:hypothetical protein HYN59_10440 [Flavobacterium album]|uniref:Uncharacterized protein n=1 Tax=Flavobacterium album TaxID=2175091 RepID=A0A2S1QYK5_9FLAO|nr:hypothetical protein [Flavobacterium album]AWH85507.1 hypothetical protein HYN59_10440 [Flavobacterium album]